MNKPLRLHTFYALCISMLLGLGTAQSQVPCTLNLSCPADIVINLAGGACDEIVTYTVQSSTDCMMATLEQTDNSGYSSGDAFPIGITTQSFRYYTDEGQEVSCSFTIEVIPDPAIPVNSLTLSCNDDVHISVNDLCEVLITPDMILEGDFYSCITTANILIKTLSGTVVSNPVSLNPQYATTSYYVEITHPISGNKCWSTIHLEDYLDPTITCDCPPDAWMIDPDCNKLCTDIEDLITGVEGIPLTEDNCRDTKAYLNGYELEDLIPCGERILRQFWTVQYTDGDTSLAHTVNCINEYYIQKSDITDIVWPDHVIIDCADADIENITHPDSTGYPTLNGENIFSDNTPENLYCSISANYTDLEIPVCINGCENTKKISRTWTKIDWCTSEVFEDIQVIKITDDEKPVIEMESVTAYTDAWSCFGEVWFETPVVSDNCDPNVDWYILSSNSGATLVDEDGASNSTKPKKHAINVPKGQWVFRLAAIDCCGNMGIINVDVNLVDLTPPTVVALENIVVSLSTNPDGEDGLGVGKLFIESVDRGSYDNCGPVKIELRRDSDNCELEGNDTYSDILNPFCDPNYSPTDMDKGEFVKFCCKDIEADGDNDGEVDGLVKVWIRAWDDANMDGFYGSSNFINNPGTDHDHCEILDNYNEAWVYVLVEDKLGPLVDCPMDITIDCSEDVTDLSITGEAKAYSLCDSYEVEYEDDSDVHCGEGIIYRRWTAVGTTNSCIQRITVTSTHIFSLECPIDPVTQDNKAIVYCDNYEIPEPIYTGGVCDFVGVTTEIDTFWFEPDACYKVIKTWIFMDWCTGNEYECNFTVHKTDDQAPLVMCQDTCVGVDDFWDIDGDDNTCELANDVLISAVGTDEGDCESDWIKWEIEIDYWSDGSIDRTLSSGLFPNNPDYTAPSLSGTPKTISLDKDEASAEWARHTVKWKANDGCGNVTSCTQIVEVSDKKAPTPYCVSVSTAIMPVGTVPSIEVWARDFNLGSFDNCSGLKALLYTFNNVSPVLSLLDQSHCFDENGMQVPCSQYDNLGYPIQKWDPIAKSSAAKFIGTVWCGVNPLNISVWDEKLNTDFCQIDFTIDGEGCLNSNGGNNAIAGNIETADGKRLANVTVELTTNDPEYPKHMTTLSDGIYAFYDNPLSLNYTVTPEKDGDDLNGVSTLDILMMQNHIIGQVPFTDNSQYLAADVNADEKVTSIDLVELRKLVLGVYEELPQNTSWIFIDKEASSPLGNPWPFLSESNIFNLTQNTIDEDFIGIKVGDINSSAQVNLTEEIIEYRSQKEITIIIEQIGTQLNFKAGVDFRDVTGFQFAITGQNKIRNIEPKAINIQAFNFSCSPTHIKCSYNADKKYDVEEGDILFTLDLYKIQENFVLDTEMMSAEIYLGTEHVVHPLKLQEALKTDFLELKNIPNPFQDFTDIQFSLEKSGDVELNIYNVQGNKILTKKSFLSEGQQSIRINKTDLNTAFSNSAVYIYEIKTKQYTEAKRMLLVK